MLTQDAPMVVTWYRGFCKMAAILYGILAIAGLSTSVFQEALVKKGYPEIAISWLRVFYVYISLPLCMLAIVALLLPRRSWTWTAHAVNMFFNFLNPCFLPFMILMLMSWVKPQTRAYFSHNG